MGEDKRKPESAKTPKPHDDITDGFIDLSEVYTGAPVKSGKKPLSREEQLRLRDEKRREEEMVAIREDIERRYSIQLEQAQSNAEETQPTEDQPPKKPIIEFEVDASVVDEELGRMDELISGEIVEPLSDSEPVPLTESKTESESQEETDEEKTEKKIGGKQNKKSDRGFNLSECSSVYAFIYILGDSASKLVAGIFSLIIKIISAPFKWLAKLIRLLSRKSGKKAKEYIRSTLKEAVYFRREIKSASKSIRKAFRKPKSLPAVISHYFKKALSRHKKLLKTAANVAMPVLSVFILIITVSFWSGLTFALEVFYNNESLGYIVDESVYIEAKDIVKDRLSGGGFSEDVEATVANSANLSADYKIAVVSVEELNDAQVISDKMIENSVDSLTNACGVYIDGKFVCAVKNEADAKTVFYNILEPYETQAEAEGYVVGFAQSIDYVQGLYRNDESVIWDASKLAEKLEEPREESVIHIAEEGDTLSSIAEEYELDEDTLRQYNPEYDFNDITEGDGITVKPSSGVVNIKKTVTTSEIREVKYDTVKKKDSSKYSSYKVVEQKGVNGTERVIKTKIYIDGEHIDTKYDYETIVEPVDEIVTVGTKTYYDGVYVGTPSDSGFLWPAPSCHYVSSPYGWRSSGWHNGIDLVRAGGGANGTPVIASRSGTVEVVQRSNSGYGNMVLINHHDGYKTRYAHMISGSITVKVGDYVEAGRTLGRVGSTGNSTGPHLHFEVIYRGEEQNPKYYIYN